MDPNSLCDHLYKVSCILTAMNRAVTSFLLSSVLYGVLAGLAYAQSEPKPLPTSKKPNRVNIYYHLGSVELPEGFGGVVRANWTDAWAGTLTCKNSQMAISWRAGTIVYAADEKSKKDILWTRTEKSPEFLTELTLFRDEEGETLVARIGWLEFSTLLKDKGDQDIFMSIIRSYKKERCVGCRSLPFDLIN